jgi:hypothetical protein
MIFNNDFKVLVIATTQDVAKELVAKVQYMYDNLPVWMKSTVKENTFNKLELTFKNGSSIKAVSSSEKSARSPSISLLIIDEAAFIDKFDEIWIASQATLATGGDCIILSTPNGVGNKFHQMWVDAMEGNQGLDSEPFNPIKIPWNVHPERDQKWADEQLAKLGKRNFAQEHDCDFISSGHTVIDGEILQWYKENVVMEPIERRYANDLWIWKYPVVGRDYIVCADVSRGDGEDYSAFHVFDVDTLEQVAEYRGKVDTRSYGHLLVSIATEYNNALLAIDNSNMGWDVVQVALDLNYSNLYYSYKNDPFYDENIHLRKRYDLKNKKDMTPGFTFTHKIRGVLVSKLDHYFLEKSVIVRSDRTINELFVYMWINGKAQAQHGYNDDLVMALAMVLYLRDTALRMRQAGIELTKKSLQNTHKSVYKPVNNNLVGKFKLPGGRGYESLDWLK